MAKNRSIFTTAIVISFVLIFGIGAYAIWQGTQIKDLEAKLTDIIDDDADDAEPEEPSSQASKDEGKNKSKSSESAVPGDEPGKQSSKEFGYIKKVTEKSGKDFLVIDYAQWLTDKAASKAATEDGFIARGQEVENDYYIRNNNPKLRTFEIDPSVKITMKTWKMDQTGQVGPKSITLAQFKNIYTSADSNSEVLTGAPYWIELKNNKVTSITEQYIP